jgi:hypothetical protein
MSCGRAVKGYLVDDDTLPCGTRIYAGDTNNRTVTVLLCAKCLAEQAAEEKATCPNK